MLRLVTVMLVMELLTVFLAQMDTTREQLEQQVAHNAQHQAQQQVLAQSQSPAVFALRDIKELVHLALAPHVLPTSTRPAQEMQVAQHAQETLKQHQQEHHLAVAKLVITSQEVLARHAPRHITQPLLVLPLALLVLLATPAVKVNLLVLAPLVMVLPLALLAQLDTTRQAREQLTARSAPVTPQQPQQETQTCRAVCVMLVTLVQLLLPVTLAQRAMLTLSRQQSQRDRAQRAQLGQQRQVQQVPLHSLLAFVQLVMLAQSLPVPPPAQLALRPTPSTQQLRDKQNAHLVLHAQLLEQRRQTLVAEQLPKSVNARLDTTPVLALPLSNLVLILAKGVHLDTLLSPRDQRNVLLVGHVMMLTVKLTQSVPPQLKRLVSVLRDLTEQTVVPTDQTLTTAAHCAQRVSTLRILNNPRAQTVLLVNTRQVLGKLRVPLAQLTPLQLKGLWHLLTALAVQTSN